jgi:hypothetical protein
MGMVIKPAAELIETSIKKVRGRPSGSRAQASTDLINAMYAAAKKTQPNTGRGIGYQLFTVNMIPSMARKEMARVYRLLKEAREEGKIPWGWIVDETREEERVGTWDDPAQYARCVARGYRRDFWNQQKHRVLVVSEKGTVRGLLQPVLDEYAVGFRVMHGFTSATTAHDLAEDDDGRPLIILYVGDFDPSGMYMSEEDLPARFAKYNGDHIKLKRIALIPKQLKGLPSFPASDKRKDPRYKWFVANYGRRCWEIDAMNPNDLRRIVKREIVKLIEPAAWERCKIVNEAERESLQTVMSKWGRKAI